MAGVDLSYAIGLEPAEAVRYFESKGYQLGFRWQDVAAEAHARAFTVAGVMKVDVLQDIRAVLADSLKSGKTFEQFKDDLIPTLKKKGWFGHGDVVDDGTGEIQGRRLTPRRLDTIFRTNMQSSYMAGRFATQMAQVDTRPWWEYVAILDNRTRPAHAALHGCVYRYDDPFWAVFYPPCGYRCRCRVRTRPFGYRDSDNPPTSAGRLEEIEQPVGRDGKTQPAIAYKSPITGKRVLPDPGFGFNPGLAWQRPFTPPPMGTLPRSVPSGASVPLPRPARIARSSMPAGLPESAYADAFLRTFGANANHPVTFNDATGEAMPINAWLFRDHANQPVSGAARPDAQIVAQAINEPDEIWLSWAQLDNQWTLRRRYLKTFETEAGEWGVAIADFGKNGWVSSSSTFPAETGTDDSRAAYLDTLRGQFLRYRKRDD
ncbi:phage head morphogenesis, SPP1 gp7 family domain protein [Burkholderia sp. MSHR3999]|uniref:phage minor head protein n=1 Tax=Burkholderia sp. MSHR3999 TaxID=1542965 RepID=UPI0005AC33FB|nr:phage minor head protein [Burkholderia sp. MSHR3999]KIP18015.1 phage head morphogenesis, SPP1 gp7 family domain protein [Burkholderia sp. MSHR3999]